MEGYSVGIVESQAISSRLVNPQYQEILDPDNSEVISQTRLFDDKPKPDCQGDETSSFVNLDFSSVFNDSVDFNTDKYSDDSESLVLSNTRIVFVCQTEVTVSSQQTLQVIHSLTFRVDYGKGFLSGMRLGQ